jgi:hypothetical protein
MKTNVSKAQWVALFRELGLDETQMRQWHRLFEARHPDGHQGFLEWLGIPAAEINTIRAASK